MLRRYPYWGWLLISLILWCINGFNFHLHEQAMLPEKMATAINKDLRQREAAFEKFAEDKDIIRHIFTDSLTEDESRMINDLPFFIYGYNKDTLKFWNTNSVIAASNDSAVVIRNEKGVFTERSVNVSMPGGSRKLVALFPVLITYPLENDYLKSHFVASDNIPVNTRIIAGDKPEPGAYAVKAGGNNTPVFYLQFNTQDIQPWSPDGLFLSILIAALLASIWWIQLMTIYLTRNKSPMTGFIVTIVIIGVFRTLLYVYGLPFNLKTLTFFSPVLYASGIYLTSLGDLLINTLCVLWIVIFITRHTPYRTYFAKLQGKKTAIPVAIALIVALFAYVYLFVNIIRGLVLDSSISFDVSHFYSINIYTILGLLVIGSITGISCLVIYVFNVQLSLLVHNKLLKYIMVLLIGIGMVWFAGTIYNHGAHRTPFDWKLYWVLLGWLLVFIPLLDIRNFTLVSDLFEPHMIFWAVFICVFCTAILQYFNEVKELETRIAFVQQRLSPHPDNLTEFTFDKTAKEILNDTLLKDFFDNPSAGSRKTLNLHFESQYLGSLALKQYQSTVYLFDANGDELFNKDTITDYNKLLEERNESDSTNSSYLFYKQDIHERHYYIAYIPVTDSLHHVTGYVILDLDLKKQATETVYPELLQPTAKTINSKDNEYAYAVYQNGKLVSQTNDYPFSTYMDVDTLMVENYAFHINNGVSELHYKIAEKRSAVIVHLHNHIIEIITLFSYLFGIQVLLAAIILIYQLYLSYFSNATSSGKFIKLTLRKRVHFSMLFVALISFIIIGSVTIYVFTDQFNTSNKNKLQAALQNAKQSVQENLKQEGAFTFTFVFDTVSKSMRLKNYITAIANAQKIDVNIFNADGVLMNTSEDDIYTKGLISPIMRPDAYHKLNVEGKSIVIQNERVAGLSYLSAYQPLRNDHGITLGYINVPFFSSEKDLHFQISNIVVTLINLYAFIFLLSSLITVLITRWITRTFNIIIEQFGRLNLQRNERISWPYDDEIGLLVSEYNKMVNKVEENAALLAQSERESAWREMARQVAHEIKNPLTPMKLNIQYLQQAVKNDNPNIKELTDKVSLSIIEQIDNLSYIASEFSNFAKMPEARPEEMELSALLNKAAELYRNDAHINLTVSTPDEKIFVYSDHSQLLRVFTNLLENAKQAIPDNRTGNIAISIMVDNENAVIKIADDGIGIPEDVIKNMFQPYFTTKSSGTGLGLAMTKKIIEFWKGEIWFETTEGVGTAFYIRLPLIKPLNA